MIMPSTDRRRSRMLCRCQWNVRSDPLRTPACRDLIRDAADNRSLQVSASFVCSLRRPSLCRHGLHRTARTRSSSALISSHASNGIPPEGEAGRIPNLLRTLTGSRRALRLLYCQSRKKRRPTLISFHPPPLKSRSRAHPCP